MSGSGVLKTGPLDSVRDFIDVAEAGRIVVDLPFTADDEDKVYNVCTGNGLSLSNLVGRLIAVSRVDVLHQVDSSRRGTSDLPMVIGSPERLRRSNIEVPRLPVDRLLEEMLEAERSRLRTMAT